MKGLNPIICLNVWYHTQPQENNVLEVYQCNE